MDALLQQMLSGELTWFTALAWALVGWIMSLAGGALAGLLMAGDHIGSELSVIMGGVYGTTIGPPAAIVGLLVLQAL
jgi:uncharacterized membrane protein